MNWSTDDIPDLTGKRAVITGVTGGLGFHTALELARHGAELVVTARDASKADDVVARLRKEVPDVSVDVVPLDLVSLADAKRAASEVTAAYDRVDILINNAGIMAAPSNLTVDGFELQIGTNHLGHFAWTATLWPLLKASDARVVTVSSLMHAQARGFDLRSLDPAGSPRRYRRWVSYSESKLANLSFALELNRRVKEAGLGVVSVGAHPGLSSTNLQKTGVSMGGGVNTLAGIAMHQATRIVGQSAAMGAWPLIMAATDPSLTGGEYIGPSSLGQTRGRPQLVGMTHWGRDEDLADNLWDASEAATGAGFRV
ncbi:oxidoreductase [Aeromicrobium sp.]|uniref:oxidoreductase n=1 Tax=Aeromicrobium sp. TaxID=1871063 RepID=UPI003D6C62DB